MKKLHISFFSFGILLMVFLHHAPGSVGNCNHRVALVATGTDLPAFLIDSSPGAEASEDPCADDDLIPVLDVAVYHHGIFGFILPVFYNPKAFTIFSRRYLMLGNLRIRRPCVPAEFTLRQIIWPWNSIA